MAEPELSNMPILGYNTAGREAVAEMAILLASWGDNENAAPLSLRDRAPGGEDPASGTAFKYLTSEEIERTPTAQNIVDRLVDCAGEYPAHFALAASFLEHVREAALNKTAMKARDEASGGNPGNG